ncbi:MAG: lamin tail domain-containing protein, partial [Nanoarchaeota archaeon]
LLGINTPERGEKYYFEAKEYLKMRIEGREAVLRKSVEDKDKYGRKLRFVFLEEENINLEMVEKGFANPYFPDEDKMYIKEFREAWRRCVENNVNLCEKSTAACSVCIKIQELDYIDEEIEILNSCSLECNLDQWTIKDEGRKKFVFEDFKLKPLSRIIVKTGAGENSEEILFWGGEEYVWTDSGDSLYLRDSKNKLINYYEY